MSKKKTKTVQRPKFNAFTDYYKSRLYEYLISKLPKLTEKEKQIIKKAYSTAYKAHFNIRRKGGDREAYITHPVEVAIILADEMGFGPTTIAAALLHDVVEDSKYTIKDINDNFGKIIALIVSGVTKITDHGDKRENNILPIINNTSQTNYFLNMLTLIPDDFRVLLIKIADRLHNMRTMEDMPKNSRKIKSSENLYIYARLAAMSGLWNIKKELEDLSFKYILPKQYFKLVAIKNQCDKKIKTNIKNFQKQLKEILISDYDFEIKTTDRSLFSIYQKINKYKKGYESIHNVYSTRIIVDVSNKDKRKEKSVKRKVAYNLYLQITDHFYQKDKSFKDWILHPRNNGFSALIFVVMFERKWLEVQILSKKDSIIADKGWINKYNAPGLKNLQTQIKEDMSELVNRLDENKSTQTYQIFTPERDVVELPKGATVLDFAFRIHTNLGLKCFGANIDEKDVKVRINHVLENNNVVKIITNDSVKPKIKWLDYVTTTKAKNAIKKYLKKKIVKKNKSTKKFNEDIDFHPKKPLEINKNIVFKEATCCKPVLGDDAMAYRTNENKFIIHHESCNKVITIRASDSQNTTTVKWGDFPDDYRFLAEIGVKGEDRLGIMKDLIDVITVKLELNINKIKVENDLGLFKGDIQIFVKNIDVLNKTIDEIKKIDDMYDVFRKIN